MACWIASGAVLVPPTTSTSGMMCGGLNGCPTRTLSECLHFDCMTLGVIPEELGGPARADDPGSDDGDSVDWFIEGHEWDIQGTFSVVFGASVRQRGKAPSRQGNG